MACDVLVYPPAMRMVYAICVSDSACVCKRVHEHAGEARQANREVKSGSHVHKGL